MGSPGDSPDATHLELGQVSQVKGNTHHETAFTADTSCKFGVPRPPTLLEFPLIPQVH